MSAMSRTPFNLNWIKNVKNWRSFVEKSNTVFARCIDFDIDYSIFGLASAANVYRNVFTQNFNSLVKAWQRFSSRIDHERSSCRAWCLYSNQEFLIFLSAARSELSNFSNRWYGKCVNFVFSVPTWVFLDVLWRCQAICCFSIRSVYQDLIVTGSSNGYEKVHLYWAWNKVYGVKFSERRCRNTRKRISKQLNTRIISD